MGIRFACHSCSKQLNIKRELGGRRGVCPVCSVRFRIPPEDAETSIPIESSPTIQAAATPLVSGGARKTTTPAATPKNASTDPNAIGGNQSRDIFDEPDVSAPSDSWATILDDDLDATWYVRPPSGGQYGPASSTILKQWIDEGRVAATALLWRDGWPQWREATASLPELAARLPNGNVVARVGSPVGQGKPVSSAPLPQLSGQASVGSERRIRSMKRVLIIGLLSALAVTLIGVLVLVVNR